MAGEVLGQVVGRLGDPGPDDEREPRVLQGVQVSRGQHPRVGDHDHVRHPVPLGKRAQHRDEGGGLGLVALEQVDLQRKARRIDQQPDLDLGVHAVLLAHPHPPQLVFLLGLEVQRRDVVHDHRCPPRTAGVGHTGLADLVAVVTLHAPVQAAEDRPQSRRGHADLVQDADRVGLARRLDDPRQHQPLERLVADDGEPQALVGAAQHIPQQPAAHPRDPRTRPRTRTRARAPRRAGRGQVEGVLPGQKALPGDLHQHSQLAVVMRGTDVLDPDDLPALLCTICTARAPDAVGTFRMNEVTSEATNHPD